MYVLSLRVCQVIRCGCLAIYFCDFADSGLADKRKSLYNSGLVVKKTSRVQSSLTSEQLTAQNEIVERCGDCDNFRLVFTILVLNFLQMRTQTQVLSQIECKHRLVKIPFAANSERF